MVLKYNIKNKKKNKRVKKLLKIMRFKKMRGHIFKVRKEL